MTPWVRNAVVLLGLGLAGLNGWSVHDRAREREARHGQAHLLAAYRIDPGAADAMVEGATRRCLLRLLPRAAREGGVPEGLVAITAAQLRYGARWRTGMDPDRFAAGWSADSDANQGRYNASWATMTVAEREVAARLRSTIARGNDPRGCIYRAVARGAPTIYAAPGGAVALRGTSPVPTRFAGR